MDSVRIFGAAHIDAFRRDGFIVMRGMFAPDEMAQIRAWTDELAHAPEVPGKAMMYFENSRVDGSRILCRIENFVPYHRGFCRLITTRRMQRAVSELFGEAAILFKDKINFKLPGGDGFLAHQDVQAGWDAFAKVHITAMIAIDETNDANGSLELIAGMHEQGVLGSMWAPLIEENTHSALYVPVHCQPGDTVFFHSYAPHRSGPNHSDKARRVLYVTYNKASEGDCRERYYVEKRRNYPPDIERDPNKVYVFKV